MFDDPRPATPEPRRRPQQWIAVALLGVALCGLVLTNVALVRSPNDDSAAVRAVASLHARNFFALDHRRAEESIDRVLALSTGKFREEFESQRAVILKSLAERKLRVTADVPDGGVALVSLDDDSAEVLVAVDVASVSIEGEERQQYRTRLYLSRASGAWLVNDLVRVG